MIPAVQALLDRLGIVYRTDLGPQDTSVVYTGEFLALKGASDRFILHEIAHWLLAPIELRKMPDFGMGPALQSIDKSVCQVMSIENTEHEERLVSILGISYEVLMGLCPQESLKRFGWINIYMTPWSQICHFMEFALKLEKRGFIRTGKPTAETI